MVLRLGTSLATAALITALVGVSELPAVAQSSPTGTCSAITGVLPAPHAVIAADAPINVHAFAQCEGNASLSLTLDGKPIDTATASPGLISAELTGLNPGVHTFGVHDGAGVKREWPVVIARQKVTRIFGEHRVATAIALADQLVTNWGDTYAANPRVIIINGEREADAIAATPLAHKIKAPILLANQDGLPEATAAWLNAHPKADVIAIGGEAVIGQGVLDQLGPLSKTVMRIGGETRYATAASVAKELLTNHEVTNVVIADAARWTDGLPSAVYAARHNAALVVTDAGQMNEPVQALVNTFPNIKGHLEVTGSTIAQSTLDALNVDQPITRLTQPVQPPLAMLPIHPDHPQSGALSAGLVGIGTQNRTGAIVLTSATNAIDGITAGPLAAQTDGLVLGDVAGAGALTASVQTQHQLDTQQVIVVGGQQALPEADLTRFLGLGIDARTVQDLALPKGTIAGDTITFTWTKPLTGGSIYVQDANGKEVPGVGSINGTTMSYRIAPGAAFANPVTATVLTVDAHQVRHQVMTDEIRIAKTDKNGWLIAPGTGPVIGHSGRLYTWVAAVEPSTNWSISDWNALAERVLNDKRGWTHDGKVRLQRIDDPTKADIRLVLATPKTVDAECRKAGLNTGGRLSCWNNTNAMVNLDRVNTGVPTFSDLEVYRTYVISHEFGHGLGHGHITTPCKDPNQLAPVMMQQSKNLRGCKPNGWPFPHAQ